MQTLPRADRLCPSCKQPLAIATGPDGVSLWCPQGLCPVTVDGAGATIEEAYRALLCEYEAWMATRYTD